MCDVSEVRLKLMMSAVAPTRAVSLWRAITLTFLAKREPHKQQCAQDTESVMVEIYSTLATLLPPPPGYATQLRDSLRNVLRLAVSISIEMRTQRAEYMMLPPLGPEYYHNGDIVAKLTFGASTMNESSGEAISNEELEAERAVVQMVLFPLLVKKGDDYGEGEEEIVVCRAQVLVAKPNGVSRVSVATAGRKDGQTAPAIPWRDARNETKEWYEKYR